MHAFQPRKLSFRITPFLDTITAQRSKCRRKKLDGMQHFTLHNTLDVSLDVGYHSYSKEQLVYKLRSFIDLIQYFWGVNIVSQM